MNTTKKTNEDKVDAAIDLLKEAAVNFVKENPNHSTSDVGAILFPHWFDERGYVVMTILARLEDEGVLQSTGGGRGRKRLWTVVDTMEIDEKVKQFINAATDGDIAKLKRLIAEADINAKGAAGAPALTWAVFYGRVEVIEVLIDAGVDVNVPQNNGSTALMVAALYGQVEMVKILIDAGANLNVVDNNYGDTALMAAVRKIRTEVVRILLDAGADVNVKNNDGKTALDIANSDMTTSEIAKILKEHLLKKK